MKQQQSCIFDFFHLPLNDKFRNTNTIILSQVWRAKDLNYGKIKFFTIFSNNFQAHRLPRSPATLLHSFVSATYSLICILSHEYAKCSQTFLYNFNLNVGRFYLKRGGRRSLILPIHYYKKGAQHKRFISLLGFKILIYYLDG